MTERIILELKNKSKMKIKDSQVEKFSDYLKENKELITILQDIDLTLQSLNYTNKEIKKLFPILVNEIRNKKKSMLENDKITFECILKLAMHHLDNNSNLGR